MKSGIIIFSSSYANLLDYFEAYKLELRLGEFITNLSDLNKYRESLIKS